MTDPHHAKDGHEFDGFPEPTTITPPVDRFEREAKLIKVIDADTFRLEIDLGWTIWVTSDVRPARCNAPEHRLPELVAGRFVTLAVQQWIDDGDSDRVVIQSKEFSVGKYGRCLCELWFAGRNLSSWLLSNRLAWPMDDRGRILGERDIQRLTGLPERIRTEVNNLR